MRPVHGTFLALSVERCSGVSIAHWTALLMREVISASMVTSADIIEPRYVNECMNSTSSPSMFIGVVFAEEGEIIVALVFVQLIDNPTLAASLLNMRSTHGMSPEEGENSAMSSA